MDLTREIKDRIEDLKIKTPNKTEDLVTVCSKRMVPLTIMGTLGESLFGLPTMEGVERAHKQIDQVQQDQKKTDRVAEGAGPHYHWSFGGTAQRDLNPEEEGKAGGESISKRAFFARTDGAACLVAEFSTKSAAIDGDVPENTGDHYWEYCIE